MVAAHADIDKKSNSGILDHTTGNDQEIRVFLPSCGVIYVKKRLTDYLLAKNSNKTYQALKCRKASFTAAKPAFPGERREEIKHYILCTYYAKRHYFPFSMR